MVVLGYLHLDSHIRVRGRCTLHYRRGPLPPWPPPSSSSPVVPATFPGLPSSRWRRPRRFPSSSFSFPLMPPHPSPSVRSSSPSFPPASVRPLLLRGGGGFVAAPSCDRPPARPPSTYLAAQLEHLLSRRSLARLSSVQDSSLKRKEKHTMVLAFSCRRCLVCAIAPSCWLFHKWTLHHFRSHFLLLFLLLAVDTSFSLSLFPLAPRLLTCHNSLRLSLCSDNSCVWTREEGGEGGREGLREGRREIVGSDDFFEGN